MRRADRLFQIVQHLRGGRLLTAQALANLLEVSKRTVYRDIADLQSAGVPIDGEAGYGYVLQDGFDIPPLMFTTDEIVALVAGARLVQGWGGARMAASAEEALIKIEAVLPERARDRARAVQVHSFGLPMSDALRGALDRIEAAVTGRVRLAFAYRDAAGRESQRCVRPLGLWFWAPAWTLVAWCETRGAFRTFRVDRISDLREEAAFKPERGRLLADFYRHMEATEGRLPGPLRR